MKTSDVFIGALDLSPYFRSIRSFVSYESSRRGLEIFFVFPPNYIAHDYFSNLLCLHGDVACYVVKRSFLGKVSRAGYLAERANAEIFLKKGKLFEYYLSVCDLRWEGYAD